MTIGLRYIEITVVMNVNVGLMIIDKLLIEKLIIVVVLSIVKEVFLKNSFEIVL